MEAPSLSAARAILSLYFPLTRFFRKEFRGELGLTPDQFRVLMMIRFGCHQVGKLARQNAISQPAMSKTIDLLVSRGFIKRLADRTDRRQTSLQLTKKAETRLTAIGGRVAEKLSDRLKNLPSTKLRSIATVFEDVCELLSETSGISTGAIR